jgi:hypothetical protein
MEPRLERLTENLRDKVLRGDKSIVGDQVFVWDSKMKRWKPSLISNVLPNKDSKNSAYQAVVLAPPKNWPHDRTADMIDVEFVDAENLRAVLNPDISTFLFLEKMKTYRALQEAYQLLRDDPRWEISLSARQKLVGLKRKVLNESSAYLADWVRDFTNGFEGPKPEPMKKKADLSIFFEGTDLDKFQL